MRSLKGWDHLEMRSLEGRDHSGMRSLEGQDHLDVRSLEGRNLLGMRSLEGRYHLWARSLYGLDHLERRWLLGEIISGWDYFVVWSFGGEINRGARSLGGRSFWGEITLWCDQLGARSLEKSSLRVNVFLVFPFTDLFKPLWTRVHGTGLSLSSSCVLSLLTTTKSWHC